jgi:signal transduction histidine kinase
VRLRTGVGAALVAGAALVLAPDPRHLDAPRLAIEGAWVDASLRVPFAAGLLQVEPAQLQAGERVLGLRGAGDAGLVAPRDQAALLDALAELGAGAALALDVHGPWGHRRVATRVIETRVGRALVAQWPLVLATAALLLFALACALGGRHPVATPLFAVAACVGGGLGAALGPALPGDGGLLDLPEARARLGVLAWCALPAALLHLAARFPVVVPSFRRPGIAAAPYLLWALPALVAQLRFHEPATVDAVERVALAASFLAGGMLVVACVFPVRALSAVERARAHAALAAFAAAGVGPLALFVGGSQPAPAASALLALAALALPLALGFSVARYRLLDPPGWLRRGIASVATALVALVCAVTLTGAAWESPRREPAHGAALALSTALAYQAFRSAATRLLAPRMLAADAPGRLLTRASRELADAASPHAVLARFAALVREELRPGSVVAFVPSAESPASLLAERALQLWRATPGGVAGRFVCSPRSEDPAPTQPEVVLALEPRSCDAALLALAARDDGLPFAAPELRALADAARLATLAMDAAVESERLEARVALRTAELSRALDDRGAVLAAAARIQAAARVGDVRAAAIAFLACACDRAPQRDAGAASPNVVSIALDTGPARSERWRVTDLAPERAADLQPQADAVATLANLALERIRLLAQLKSEVARQARELAAAASGERCAAFVREVAHELRKPTEEIRQLAHDAADDAGVAARASLARIEAATHELSRRLDCLLSRGARRLDLRRVDLVRVTDEIAGRVARLRRDRRFSVRHAQPRLPLVADPVRVASLLENLLDNAVKATPPGGAVAIRTAFEDGPHGARVVLEVEDDGVGIAPELGAEIFEPGVGGFRQGFGLGLALCRDVAAAHGGAIAVESAPGRTLFRVALPQLGPTS